MGEPLRVFISYSHKDVKLKDKLLEHLCVLERFHDVTVWTDTQIPPGARWREEIDRAMAATDVALLLTEEARETILTRKCVVTRQFSCIGRECHLAWRDCGGKRTELAGQA
jgi:hypothetical protein